MAVFARYQSGDFPVMAVAVHDGHRLSRDVESRIALSESERLREEDPFTGGWARMTPVHVIARYSRFEVDLNRPRDQAIYQRPEDAWGLTVWSTPLPAAIRSRSLARYDEFYGRFHSMLTSLVTKHRCVSVLDLHTYNHRRSGPDGPPADPTGNPDINIGTGTMERDRWGSLIDRFCDDLSKFRFGDRRLDVRENVKFFGGQVPRWVHDQFPLSVCALAIEVKKIFMDEWTGELDLGQYVRIDAALRSAIPGLLQELEVRRRDRAA